MKKSPEDPCCDSTENGRKQQKMTEKRYAEKTDTNGPDEKEWPGVI